MTKVICDIKECVYNKQGECGSDEIQVSRQENYTDKQPYCYIDSQ